MSFAFVPRKVASQITAQKSDAEKAAEVKRQERMKKLRELHLRRNEARKLNHQEVVEEDRKSKLPANYETKRKWAEWKVSELEKKQEYAAKGEDYERARLLDVQATEAEKWERIKKKKKNPDQGFSDYEAATKRQYDRLIKNMKVDMDTYQRQKEKNDNEASGSSVIPGTHKPTEEAVDKLADTVEKLIEKRAKYSRRRAYDDDADIDYINERNAKFNKKLERFYGEYTAEIKQNLERGTAV